MWKMPGKNIQNLINPLSPENEKKSIQVYITKSHGKQQGGCEVRQMNPQLGEWQASPDTRQKSLVGQQPGSNWLVRKLQLLIYKDGIY